MSEKKDTAQFKVNVDIIERIERLEDQVSNLNTMLRDAEKLSCRIQMLELKNRDSDSPAPMNNESGMSEGMKQKLILAHLVSAIRDIVSTFGDMPTMLQALEEQLDKINQIYANNLPASVSDGKWEIRSIGGATFTVCYNNIIIAIVDAKHYPAFRTLIAREKLCEKMYKWMMKDSKLWSQFSYMTNDSLYKPQAENRNTLIAEYEEAGK